MKLQLSPTVLIITPIIVGATLTAVAQGAIPVPMGVPEIIGAYAKSWATTLLAIYTIVVVPTMNAMANSKPGPLAPADPPLVVAATKQAAALEAAGK